MTDKVLQCIVLETELDGLGNPRIMIAAADKDSRAHREGIVVRSPARRKGRLARRVPEGYGVAVHALRDWGGAGSEEDSRVEPQLLNSRSAPKSERGIFV